MKKRLVSMTMAALMLMSSTAVTAFAEDGYEEVGAASAQTSYRQMLKIDPEIVPEGIKTWNKSYDAGIAATQDSNDFVLDCSSKAGYEYLGKMSKGKKMQKVYNGMWDAARELWSDTSSTLDTLTVGINTYACYGIVYGEGLTFDEMCIVYYTFRNDNPLFYYAGMTALADDVDFYMAADTDYRFGSARASYQRNIKTYVKSRAEWAESVAEMTPMLAPDYLKARAAHNSVVDDVDYAFDLWGDPSMEEWAHSILGAVEKGEGVCETYARTYQLLMNYLDIDNYLVTGMAGGAHAWNMVRLDDGKYYYVDCTWDDSPYGYDYTYFAVGSNFMDQDHTPDRPSNDPQTFLIELPTPSKMDFDPFSYNPAPKFQLGDVNGDGKVNAADISLLAAHVKGVSLLTGDHLAAANVNKDNKVDFSDIQLLAAKVKGLA